MCLCRMDVVCVCVCVYFKCLVLIQSYFNYLYVVGINNDIAPVLNYCNNSMKYEVLVKTFGNNTAYFHIDLRMNG